MVIFINNFWSCWFGLKGTSGPFFVPKMTFELLDKDQIKLLAGPSEQCVDQVYKELRNIVQGVLNQVGW